MPIHRFAVPEDATRAEAIAAVTGPIRELRRSPLSTSGFTNASHERIHLTLESGGTRSLVLKRVAIGSDWMAVRTGDRGREALQLGDPALEGVWQSFACPYLAFGADADEITLLMDDLSPHLFPEVRAPLAESEEDRVMEALADLHARFWRSPALEIPWLARGETLFGYLDANLARDERALGRFPPALAGRLARGWQLALGLLPSRAAERMTAPAAAAFREWSHLPLTLVHGDSKVANFAGLPDGRIAAFDWAIIGAAPVAIELGWYLAVNAPRLARPKDAWLARYRERLGAKLAEPLDDATWHETVRASTVCGARMLLWSKALAMESGKPGAREEWEWWASSLDALD